MYPLPPRTGSEPILDGYQTQNQNNQGIISSKRFGGGRGGFITGRAKERGSIQGLLMSPNSEGAELGSEKETDDSNTNKDLNNRSKGRVKDKKRERNNKTKKSAFGLFQVMENTELK